MVGRSHAEHCGGETLRNLVVEDLVAERIATETYSEVIRRLGDDDPTTRRMLEEILAMEEEHANDVLDLLNSMEKTK